MDTIRKFLLYDWSKLIVPLIVLAITLAAGLAVHRVSFGILRRWAQRAKSQGPALLVNALAGPFMIWVLMLGLHLAGLSSELPERATHIISQSLLVLWIVSLTIVATRLAGDLVRHYGSGMAGALPVTTLTQNLAQLAVVILGLLLLLRAFRIDITPILTALGVGGLAVALALQDTLSNLFGGFYVAVAGYVRIGDYIRLNTGEEGYVTDIGWRSTTLRALSNNLVVVPNAKLAQAIVTNFHLPEKRMSAQVQVGVSYDSDIQQVERVLLEVAQQAAAEVPGLLAEPQPSVSFDPGFGDSALGFTLNFHVAEFVDQYRARHELRKRILTRLRAEKIDIPFPTRSVFVRGTS